MCLFPDIINKSSPVPSHFVLTARKYYTNLLIFFTRLLDVNELNGTLSCTLAKIKWCQDETWLSFQRRSIAKKGNRDIFSHEVSNMHPMAAENRPAIRQNPAAGIC
ncbi:hypothetical protein CEXT_809301 [Caerostris extrusa]|uniref:Uncharacterized protein n=1 Tax=Caerostris extrusa TaxID=172846 RepID=A0AAV4MP85_CAEEX|nr:hypothetical protein CEXT_809301 [Caerostris extrusa]